MQSINPQRYLALEVLQSGPVLEVWLNRPEVLNAFNAQTIAELTTLFTELAQLPGLRAVLLAGQGKMFCAGADLEWMRSMASFTQELNLEDARRLAAMLQAVHACPVPLIGRVQGGAFGGALGLLACCDTVICGQDAQFAFSEVRMGLAPATIAPYVLAKAGLSALLDLFLSGERFNAAQAQAFGLVHCLVKPALLDEAVEAKLEELMQAGPLAARETKALLRALAPAPSSEVMECTARLIAQLRVSAEGQEGLRAFREKRPASWQE